MWVVCILCLFIFLQQICLGRTQAIVNHHIITNKIIQLPMWLFSIDCKKCYNYRNYCHHFDTRTPLIVITLKGLQHPINFNLAFNWTFNYFSNGFLIKLIKIPISFWWKPKHYMYIFYRICSNCWSVPFYVPLCFWVSICPCISVSRLTNLGTLTVLFCAFNHRYKIQMYSV